MIIQYLPLLKKKNSSCTEFYSGQSICIYNILITLTTFPHLDFTEEKSKEKEI